MNENTRKEMKNTKMSNSYKDNKENEGETSNGNINYSNYMKMNSFDNRLISTNNITEKQGLTYDEKSQSHNNSNKELNNKIVNGSKKINKPKSNKLVKQEINNNITNNSYFDSNSMTNNTIIPGNLNNFNIINSYMSYDANANVDLNNHNTGTIFNNFNNKENTMNFNGGFNPYSINNDSMFKSNLFGGFSNDFFLNQHSINMYNLFDKTVNNENGILNSNAKNNNYGLKPNPANNFSSANNNNHNIQNVNSLFSSNPNQNMMSNANANLNANDENKRQQFQNLNLINIMNHIHPPYTNFPIKNLNDFFYESNSNVNLNIGSNSNHNNFNNYHRNRKEEENELLNHRNDYSNVNFHFNKEENNSNNIYIRKKQIKSKITTEKIIHSNIDNDLLISKNLSHDYKSKKEIDKNLNIEENLDDQFLDFNKKFYSEDYLHADIIKENLLKSNFSLDDSNLINKGSNKLLSKEFAKYSRINNEIFRNLKKTHNSNKHTNINEVNTHISLKERDSNETERISENENHSGSENCFGIKDQNFLPIANIKRIIKNTFKDKNECKLSQEAVKSMLEILNEFIAFVTSEAVSQMKSEKKQNSKKECKKTLNGCHLIKALSNLGFESYAYVLESYFSKMDHDQRGNRSSALVDVNDKHEINTSAKLQKNTNKFSKGLKRKKFKNKLEDLKSKYLDKNNTNTYNSNSNSNNSFITGSKSIKTIKDKNFNSDNIKLREYNENDNENVMEYGKIHEYENKENRRNKNGIQDSTKCIYETGNIKNCKSKKKVIGRKRKGD